MQKDAGNRKRKMPGKKMRSPYETAGVMDDEKRRRKEADKRSKEERLTKGRAGMRISGVFRKRAAWRRKCTM